MQLFRDKSINGLLQSEVELCTRVGLSSLQCSGVCGTRSFHRETRDCVVNRLMSMENAYSRERHAKLVSAICCGKRSFHRDETVLKSRCDSGKRSFQRKENVPIGRDVIVGKRSFYRK